MASLTFQAYRHIEGLHRRGELPMLAHIEGTNGWLLGGWIMGTQSAPNQRRTGS